MPLPGRIFYSILLTNTQYKTFAVLLSAALWRHFHSFIYVNTGYMLTPGSAEAKCYRTLCSRNSGNSAFLKVPAVCVCLCVSLCVWANLCLSWGHLHKHIRWNWFYLKCVCLHYVLVYQYVNSFSQRECSFRAWINITLHVIPSSVDR